MKKILSMIVMTLLVSPIQSFACKMTPAGADAAQMSAVLNFVAAQAGKQNFRIMSVTNRGTNFLVQIRNGQGSPEIHMYEASMSPDCRVSVNEAYK